MAVDRRGVEAELRALLETAQGPDVMRERAQNILKQAREVAVSAPSGTTVSLLHQIESILKPILIGRSRSLSRSCQLLVDELDQAVPVTPQKICKALRTSGFSKDSDLGLQETRSFYRILSKSLRDVERQYQQAKLVDRDRLKDAIRQLEELGQDIPERVTTARDFVTTLVDKLKERLEAQLAQRDLEELLDELRTRIQEHDVQHSHERLTRELASNAWFKAHSHDDRATEVRKLALRLQDLGEAYRNLGLLPSAVATCLAKNRIRAAIVEIKDAQSAADSMQLIRLEPLQSASVLVIDKLEQIYRSEEKAATAEEDPVAEVVRKRIETLGSVRGWLNLLPGELLGDGAELRDRCQALVDDQRGLLRQLLLASHQEDLRELPVGGLLDYSRRLKRSQEPLIHELGRQLYRLWAAMETVRNVEEDVDESVLRRLESAGSELAPGPVSEEALDLVSDYQNALAKLSEIDAEVDLGDASSEQLLGQIRPIVDRFPQWRRAESLEKRVRDADLLRELKQAAGSGSEANLEKALRLAGEISSGSLRRRLEGALGQLEQVYRQVRLAEAARGSLEGETAPNLLEDGIDSAVQALSGFLQLSEQSVGEDSREEFPEAWQGLERVMTQLLMSDLPKSAERWLDAVVAVADSEKRLEKSRSRFQTWLQVLEDELLRDRGDRFFNRRTVELELESLAAQGHLEEAQQELADRSDVFESQERREWEKKLALARAVASYRRGEDPDVTAVMESIRKYGLSLEVLDVLADHFQTEGSPLHLAELARSYPEDLADFGSEAMLAGWCMAFLKQEHDSLCQQLAHAGDRKALETWLAAITRFESSPEALYHLHEAMALEPGWAPEIKRLAEGQLTELRGRVTRELEDLVGALKALKARGQEEDPESSRDAATDQQRRDMLQDAFETARAFIEEASTKLERWHPFLVQADRWLLSTELLPKLPAVLGEVADFQQRLRADLEILDELAEVKDLILRDHPTSLGALKAKMVAIKSIGRVQRVFAAINQYFSGWQRVLSIVEDLVAAHSAGGAGLTSEQLRSLCSELEDELDYDFQRAADRFNLLPRFGGLSYLTFVEELTDMIDEIEEVDLFENRCRALVMRVRGQLKRRLKKSGKARGAARERHRQALVDLLGEPDDEGWTLKALYEERPRPSKSSAAVTSLEALQSRDWYQLLQTAAQAAS